MVSQRHLLTGGGEARRGGLRGGRGERSRSNGVCQWKLEECNLYREFVRLPANKGSLYSLRVCGAGQVCSDWTTPVWILHITSPPCSSSLACFIVFHR